MWTGYARYGWDYNRLYDLYYQAGIPLSRQRVASPFISQAVSTLHLYKVIDPDTWGRMVSRVNGVSFAGMYGNTVAMGWRSISCPDGFTWKEYMYFLLDTLPRATRENYLEKLRVSQKFWREKEAAWERKRSGSCVRPVYRSRWKNARHTGLTRGPSAWSI